MSWWRHPSNCPQLFSLILRSNPFHCLEANFDALAFYSEKETDLFSQWKGSFSWVVRFVATVWRHWRETSVAVHVGKQSQKNSFHVLRPISVAILKPTLCANWSRQSSRLEEGELTLGARFGAGSVPTHNDDLLSEKAMGIGFAVRSNGAYGCYE